MGRVKLTVVRVRVEALICSPCFEGVKKLVYIVGVILVLVLIFVTRV